LVNSSSEDANAGCTADAFSANARTAAADWTMGDVAADWTRVFLVRRGSDATFKAATGPRRSVRPVWGHRTVTFVVDARDIMVLRDRLSREVGSGMPLTRIV
jgi:hypothetical protein